MKQPISSPPPTPPSQTRKSQDRLLLITGSLFALMVCLTLIIALIYFAQPWLAHYFTQPTATPPCVQPSLSVGPASYRIESEPLRAGGELPAYPVDPTVAYWIEGTSPNYVLLLNPDQQNQMAVASLQAGMPVSANWADCTVDSYIVQAVAELAQEIVKVLYRAGLYQIAQINGEGQVRIAVQSLENLFKNRGIAAVVSEDRESQVITRGNLDLF